MTDIKLTIGFIIVIVLPKALFQTGSWLLVVHTLLLGKLHDLHHNCFLNTKSTTTMQSIPSFQEWYWLMKQLFFYQSTLKILKFQNSDKSIVTLICFCYFQECSEESQLQPPGFLREMDPMVVSIPLKVWVTLFSPWFPHILP